MIRGNCYRGSANWWSNERCGLRHTALGRERIERHVRLRRCASSGSRQSILSSLGCPWGRPDLSCAGQHHERNHRGLRLPALEKAALRARGSSHSEKSRSHPARTMDSSRQPRDWTSPKLRQGSGGLQQPGEARPIPDQPEASSPEPDV